MISCETLKQKYSLEIVVQKILLNSEKISVVEFIFGKTEELRTFILQDIVGEVSYLLVSSILFASVIDFTSSETNLGQNTLHWWSEKRYYSIVRIASSRYVQAEDCNTLSHETLGTDKLVLFLYCSGINCSIAYG